MHAIIGKPCLLLVLGVEPERLVHEPKPLRNRKHTLKNHLLASAPVPNASHRS
jgi:hypothetical protein